ncbi:hypothetical protein [Brucella gallinifaecis]|uniref:hypothetical protein n=1 Tax=Brucella gallinifaecis TaxID=215590 RepID=UPI00235FB51A|nr:hypothetical protein [Brucella gallinifaecis]
MVRLTVALATFLTRRAGAGESVVADVHAGQTKQRKSQFHQALKSVYGDKAQAAASVVDVENASSQTR